MSATAPTPDLLAAIDALDADTPGYAPDAPTARPETIATTAATDAAAVAPAPPDPATPTDPTAPQPSESPVDYQARVRELEQQIANREWSSQGRYLQEKAKREAAEARAQQLEEGYAGEDAYRRSLYDQAIAQSETPEQRDFLAQKRDLELSQRQFSRQQQAEQSARQASQAEQQAGQQVALQFHERTMRTEALPELERQLAAIGQTYDLPEAELAPLRAQLQNPAMQQLVAQAPPQVLGTAVLQMLQHFDTQARAAQSRVVAANRQQASANGTYRGAVTSASAGQQAATLAQFAGTGDMEGAIAALFPD